jgi:hypothetical protein
LEIPSNCLDSSKNSSPVLKLREQTPVLASISYANASQWLGVRPLNSAMSEF